MRQELDHLIVGQQKLDIGVAAIVVIDQPALALQPVPQRRLRQRLQQIDREQRDLRLLDKPEQRIAGFRLVGVEPHDDAGDDFHPVGVDGVNALQDRDHHVVVLVHRLQRVGIGRLDAAEHRDEERLAHLLQNFGPLGDVQRRLAGEPHHVAGPLLPFDQMRQQVQRRLAVADEIVVDEINRASDAAFAQFVEFGDDLLRRLQARVAAIEAGDVAELALIGTAARILDAAEEVFLHFRQLIGRNRKLGHRQAIVGLQHHLLLGTRRILRQPGDELIGGVAEFADMEIVERGIVIRTRAHRRPADRDRQIEPMRAAADVVHLLALDVHAADEHRFRPLEVFLRGGANVLVDEADRPVGREVGRDQQKALRGHESLHAVGQRIGILERAKRRRVAREDAQDAPCRLDAFSSHQTSSDKASTNLSTTLKVGPEFLQDCGAFHPCSSRF